MIFGILTLITALAISAVAIYYSVAGLVAIFAAAALPIMIMGGVLEISKLVTAVWLHKYWKQATWWLKSYLSVAVVVLMFITSMGIFGFLSKAHIEQTSAGEESVAQVERLTTEIARQQAIIVRAEEQIRKLETTGTGNDSQIQAQIDKEQERIDTAYDRINPAIAEQNAIIAGVTALFQNELDKIDADIAKLQGYIDAGEIAKAQGMIGAKADGAYGPKTAAAFTDWTDAKKQERNQWLQKIQDAGASATVVAARNEIARLRANADTQIAESNKLINRLRSQLGATDKAADIDAQVDEQALRIKTANAEIDTLTEEKYALEGEYRKLEAEVGPIKYIAEFVYGEQADKNMLEQAVTWVIVIIIFVFDPLAVLLLIAAQYTFEFRRKELEDERGDRLRLEREEYERARAQRIVDNPGVTFDDPAPASDANSNEDPHKPGWMFEKEEVDVEEFDRSNDEQSDRAEEGNTETGDNTNGNGNGDNNSEDTIGASEATIWTGESGADNVGRDTSTGVDEQGEINDDNTTNETVNADRGLEQDEVQPNRLTTAEHARDYTEVNSIEKKEIKSLEELKREADYELKEQDSTFQVSKTVWKDANPDQTLKHYKNLYVKGVIDSLPWEQTAQGDNYNTSEGYRQNAEQSERTLFNKLSKK
jgi:hypothetical protein